MPAFADPLSFRRRAARLLAFGLLAVAMHALAGSGLMRVHSAGSGFFAEICTSKGTRPIDPAFAAGTLPSPDRGHQDCCTLCASGLPLLFAGAGIAVPPAPTFRSVFFSSPFPSPAAFARVSHPPRGPPAA